MNDEKRKALQYLMRNLAWLIGGVVATAIPLLATALLIFAGVQRELAVVICFGIAAICGEHMMNKFVRTARLSNLMDNASRFLACAAAYVLSAPYAARNLCLLAQPDSHELALLASIVIVSVASFQTAWLFQNLVNTETE